jgi:hypothetical protein
MARKKKDLDEEEGKQWREADLIETFNLNRITSYQTQLMEKWLDVQNPVFTFKNINHIKKPYRDSIAQILEVFLIRQTKNGNQKTLYGVEIAGKYSTFVLVEGNDYCCSPKIQTYKDDIFLKYVIFTIFTHFLNNSLPQNFHHKLRHPTSYVFNLVAAIPSQSSLFPHSPNTLFATIQ